MHENSYAKLRYTGTVSKNATTNLVEVLAVDAFLLKFSANVLYTYRLSYNVKMHFNCVVHF